MPRRSPHTVDAVFGCIPQITQYNFFSEFARSFDRALLAVFSGEGDLSGKKPRQESGSTNAPEEVAPVASVRKGLTRRDLLVGASVAMVSPVFAGSISQLQLDVGTEDSGRTLLITARNLEQGTRHWRLPAAIFGDARHADASLAARFRVARTEKGWQIELKQGSFPGGLSYRLRGDVRWSPDGGTGPDMAGQMSLVLYLAGYSLVLSTAAREAPTLTDLLYASAESDPVRSPAPELRGTLKPAQAAAFAAALFGDTIELLKGKECDLCLHRDGYWRLVPKGGPLMILRGEGLAVEAPFVAFGVLGERCGVEETPAIRPGMFDLPAPFTKETVNSGAATGTSDVRTLFESRDAPPIPGAKANAGGDSSADPEQKASPPERILYAIARTTRTDGEVYLGRIPGAAGQATGSALIRLQGLCAVAWRTTGNPRIGIAQDLAITGGMQPVVTVSDGGPVRASLPPCRGVLFRQAGTWTHGRSRLGALLEPLPQDADIETRWGVLTVAPLPPTSLRPGIISQVPLVRMAGVSNKPGERTVVQFAAPLALKSAAVGFDAERDANSFAHLRFEGTECLFRVAAVPLSHTWSDDPPHGTAPPQAEAVIHLGPLPPSEPPVRLSLNRARLKLRRPHDLLALEFRFQDLVLEYDGDDTLRSGAFAGRRSYNRWWVVPDRRLAAFVPQRPLQQLPQTAPVCGDIGPVPRSAADVHAERDPRPLMVVEFPPQHIAEQAFLRQLKAEPAPPPLPKEQALSDDEVLTLLGRRPDGAQSGQAARAARLEVRQKVRARFEVAEIKDAAECARVKTVAVQGWKEAEGEATDALFALFEKFPYTTFTAVFEKVARSARISSDQRIYIGPAFLDPRAARVARLVLRSIEAAQSKTAEGAQKAAYVLRAVPDVDLRSGDIMDLRAKFGVGVTRTETEVEDAAKPGTQEESYITDRERLKARRDADYAAFRQFYARQGLDTLSGPPPAFWGRIHLARTVGAIPDRATREAAIKRLVEVIAAYNTEAEKRNHDAFEIPAQARLSGPSRLVFRIPADDFEQGRPDQEGGRPAGAFPFTVEGLTNWGGFDLAVPRRAEKLFETYPNGRAPQRWNRSEGRDPADFLVFQGLSAGSAWARREREGRLTTDGACGPLLPGLFSRVPAALRMAELVAASRQAPRWDETSIELPFRLMLSPAQDAIWRTPLSVRGFTPKPGLPVPLWSARLDEPPGQSTLRAIWSPDYRPESLVDPSVGTPPHGPYAPWALPRDISSTQIASPPEDKSPEDSLERFRTSLDAADRHELVMLSSLHGLPVRGRRREDGALVDASQINPPPGFELRDVSPERLVTGAKPSDLSAIYRAQALTAGELTLSAIGGTLEADTSFTPPASAKVLRYEKPVDLFDALSIERWQQQTVLGRDIRVEVVYKGFLFPLGHRASLVKLTERRFLSKDGHGGPVAFLVQRFLLRVGQPEKRYPAVLQPNGGRRWPVERLEILTRTTPDLLDPTDDPAPVWAARDVLWTEGGHGRIFLRRGAGTSDILPGVVFWPHHRSGNAGELQFELQIDGRGSRVRMPLIFVDNTAANSEATMGRLTAYYNSQTSTDRYRRSMNYAGSKRRYAPELQPDDTSFETLEWQVAAEGAQRQPPSSDDDSVSFHNDDHDFTPIQQGSDQPPFYPLVEKATVSISQVGRLIGQASQTIPVRFDPVYVRDGFKTDINQQPDIYLAFDEAVSLDPKQAGDRTGGATRPNTTLIGMSRAKGPIGGKSASPTASPQSRSLQSGASLSPPQTSLVSTFKKPEVSDFFATDAKILGIFSFKDLLTFVTQSLSSTPTFKEVTHFVPTLLGDIGKVESDVGTAVARVRDGLLEPLRNAQKTMAAEWAIASGLASDVKFRSAAPDAQEDMAVQRLGALYPDVAEAYFDLKRALDRTIDTSSQIKNLGALIANFSGIYAAGRRFVAAIERIAADPVATVQAALKNAFNERVSKLQNVLIEARAAEADIGKAVKDLPRQLRDTARALLAAEALAAWRRFVFALPFVEISLPDEDARRLRRAVDEAVREAITTSDWIKPLASGNLDGAARAIADAVETRLAPDPDMKDILDRWRKSIGNAELRIRGFLFDTVMAAVERMLMAADELSRSSLSLDEIRKELKRTVDSAISLLEPALDNIQVRQQALCQEILKTFTLLLKAMSPPPAASDGIQRLMSTVATAVADLTRFRNAVEAYRAIVVADPNLGDLDQKLAMLRNTLDAAISRIQAKSEAAGQTCTALLAAAGAVGALLKDQLSEASCQALTPDQVASLPLDALGGLGAAQAAFLGAIQDLTDALHPLGAAFAHISGPLGPQLPPVPTALEGARLQAVRDAGVAIIQVAAFTNVTTLAIQEAASLKDWPAGDHPLKKAQDIVRELARQTPPQLKSVRDRLSALADQDIAGIITKGDQFRSQVKAIREAALEAASTQMDSIVRLEEAGAQLRKALEAAPQVLRLVAQDLVLNGERVVMAALAKRLAATEDVARAMSAEILPLLRALLLPIAKMQGDIVKVRESLYRDLVGTDGSAGGTSAVGDVLKNIGSATLRDIAEILIVPRPDSIRPLFPSHQPPGTSPGSTLQNDYLVQEQIELEFLSTERTATAADAIAIAGLTRDWSDGQASATVLTEKLRHAATRVLTGDLRSVVDLEGARRRIEEKIRELVPSKVEMNYDLTTNVNPVLPLFLPQGDKQLTIGIKAQYDLLNAATPPSFEASTKLCPFAINLFEVLTLVFDGASFKNDSRSGSDFNVVYRDFQLGQAAAFIKPLESYLNPGGSGPYVRPVSEGYPGIEAGYSLFLGVVAIGPLSFSNVSLNAACRLPFDNREATFSASIGRRDRPFLISALPYTGGGFLGLIATSKRILGFEASFEFGGGGAFSFGPLTGRGRMTTGIYVNQVSVNDTEQGASIEGFFYAGGEAHIAQFNIACILVVNIKQQAGGHMYGFARFTYSFSLGFTDISFEVGVQRDMGPGFSGAVALGPEGPTRFAAINDTGAPVHVPVRYSDLTIKAVASAQEEDWSTYRTYFTDDIDGFPE